MSASNQISFILDNIGNYQLLADEAGDTSTVFILDSSTDAIKQMAEILSGYSDIDAVHIISHGNSGLINLGVVQLSNDNIGEYADELSAIGAALSDEGDILVYGCEVAAGESGKTLIATLAASTGADVAASDDLTGSADKGGDWVLEFASGTVEAAALDSDGYTELLATPSDGLYTFADATEQTTGTFVTADGFFLITAYDGNGQDSFVAADESGAYIQETDGTSTGTSYIKISINGTGSFKLNDAVLGDFEPGYSDLYDVHVVGYANGTQVAVTDYHDSISVYETDYNLDFSSFSGVLVDEIRAYYSWQDGTPQFQFNLVNLTISDASTTAAPSDTAPTLTATGETPTFAEGSATGVDLFETVTASTEDSGQLFTGFTVTVTNVADITEYLTIGGTDIALTNGNSASVSGGTASVSVSGGTATVTVTGLNSDDTSFGSLIDAMTYKNSDTTATSGDRVVTITQITDDGSSNNTGSVSIAATVSVVKPSISDATYDASTGTLVVTGTAMSTGNPIDTSTLTITGESGATYTLVGSYTVTASSATSFTVVLDATDKLYVNGILNKNGASSAGSTTFNLAAASGWQSGADADTTGNGITVSNVTAPTITEASYNASTGVLTVTATNLVHLPGAANDIDASAFTFTGEFGGIYSLSNTSDVEIISATSFKITLSSTDKDILTNLITANGTSSDSGTAYNLAVADNWNGTITGGDIADTTNIITVSGIGGSESAPSIDLNGADAGTDATVSLLDAGSGLVPDAVISDTENDSGDWDGGSITIQRVDSNGDADGNVHDVYSFVSGGNFTVTGTIEQGSDSNGILSNGGTQFATWSYTSADGKLVVSFDNDASTADVNDVLAHIGYENDTPYGDAVIEVALNDGTSTTTAEVTVTSNIIHVTQTDYDTDGDTADGMSLYEALAIAKDGDTILLDDGVYRGQFNITKNVTIDALNGADGHVTIESPDSADLVQVLPDQLTNNGRWRVPVINVDTDSLNGTVTIKNITVDGREQAIIDEYNGNKDFMGIASIDSNLVIDNVVVKNIVVDNDLAELGFSENYGIFVEGSSALGSDIAEVTITNSEIYNFQKTGIIAWGSNLNVTITDNEITGLGVDGAAGQNGMQIGSGGLRTGTTATITGNTIQNIGFVNDIYASSGVLLVYADDVTINNNTIKGVEGGAGNFNGIDIMYVYDTDTQVDISGNTFVDNDTAVLNESDDAFILNVGSNDFSGATVAFYDGYDIDDPETEIPVANPTLITLTSVNAPESGVLSYYMFGGDDSFTDNGSVDSIVYAGAGNDTITTGSGDDVLVGGLGDDTLTGGDGADVFLYQSQELNADGDRVMYNVTDFGADTITDLTQSDIIRVAGEDFGNHTAENGDGLNVGANSMEVVYNAGTDTTSLYIDTNGIAGAELQINLSGEYTADQFNFSGTDITIGAEPVLDLNGAASGTGATVTLAAAANGLFTEVNISDTENDVNGWNGGSLTINRVDSDGDADGNVHDVFGFASVSGLTVTGSIAEGSDSNGTLASGGTTFATWSYDSSAGELVLSFNANATSELVQTAAAAITYTNDTPYGDAELNVSLFDGYKTTESTVTVTSNIIHVTQTDYDTDGDTADGMSLYEALAIAKDGDTILLDDGVYRGQFNITKNVTIDALNGADGHVTIESPDTADLVQVLPEMLTDNGRWRMPVLNVDTGDLDGTVTIKNITIDGRDQGIADGFANNKDLIGIGIINSNVVVDSVTVSNFRCSDENERGWGENFPILAEGSADAGGTVSVSILNSDISNYQKAGIVGWGPSLDITIDGNTITASGVDGVSGQNGIQIGSGGLRQGTSSTITNNTIQNIGFVNEQYTSAGILIAYGDDATITGNTVAGMTGSVGNLVGIDIMYAYDTDTEINISDNIFRDTDIGVNNESDNLYTLNVGSNDFSGATVAFYDGYDIDDPSAETPVANPTLITLTSVNAPESGVLSYYMFGGDDSFTDNGSVDSIVYAGAGNDTITTGSGDDVLVGGLGDDTLTGGDGADVFLYQSQELNADGDRVMYNVTDFGVDTITDLTESDVIRVTGADFEHYTAVDGDGLNVAANTMEVVQAGGNTTLYIDTDGIAGADLHIRLDGTYSAADFICSGTDIRYEVNVVPSVTITATGGTATPTTADPVALFDVASLSTGNTYQTFESLTLTVEGVEDALEYIVIDDVEVVLANGTSIAIAGGTAAVSVVNGTATLTLSGLALTNGQMESLLESIGYFNDTDTPSAGDRIITLTEIKDSGIADNTVNPNIASTVTFFLYTEPELDIRGADVNFTESGADAVSLFEITSADTGDAGQNFTGITITVTNVADETEYLVMDGTEISLVNGTIVTGAGGTATVTVVNGTATVTVTNLDLTNSEMSHFVGGIGYLNTDDTATAGDRVITITQVTDSGSENNITSMSVSATVTVSDLFFEPLVTAEATGGTQVYGDDTPVDLFGGVTADAVDDSQTFASLTLTVTGVADASEYIVIDGVEVALTDGTSIAVAGGTATVAVVNGTTTVSLTGLDLDGDAFSALVDGAGYINKTSLPTEGDRVITLTEITDNGGDNNTVTPDVATTVSVLASAAITSAAYNAATGVLTVTGTGLTAGDVIDASKLSLKGEGGSSYTLAGTYTVTATADGFALTLNAADQLNVEGILNSNGTTAAGGAAFNVAAEAGWNVTRDAAADTTGNAVTVSSLAAPAISGISYNAETGVITFTGSNFVKQPGAANDIDVSKFTFTGQGGNVTLSTTSDVEISSATTFTITLSTEDKALVNSVLDNNGTASSGGTTYNLSAADDWNGPVTGSNTADTTNPVTVSSVKAVETVDGVPVTTETVTQTQTYTDLSGNTVTREVTTETLTVAPVTDTRVNDTGAAETAEIPLFWGESSRTEWATTASLPVGVGITTTGTRSPVDERTLNDAIGDLLYFIDTTASSTDVGRTAMLSAGAGFLDAIGDSTSTLIVNKVTLTVSGSDVPDAPIVINGTPNTVATSGGTATPKEAIVIDASALPAGTELDLQNIEFAVIIGNGVIVRGGDGANIVFAGEGSQNILLGADDDELHAGAGDDIVGSLGGNDLIYGESGNDRMSGGAGNDFMHGGSGIDTVIYTGSMSDYIITRDHGLTYISPVSDPSEVDTLVNAEKIEFSDGTYDIQNSEELTFIASLYEQVLDRQPEINGFQYWADAVFDKDLSVGDMTVWFMKSAEYHDATGVDFSTLSVSDQVEQLYVALLGRPSDADGKAYWIDCVEHGHTIAEVAESFVTSVEMQGIYNLPNEWDFTA